MTALLDFVKDSVHAPLVAAVLPGIMYIIERTSKYRKKGTEQVDLGS